MQQRHDEKHDARRQLRIGELAAELGINPKTIRYYEEIGLLPAPQRTGAGYRTYGAADYDRLLFIAKAKAVGLSLTEIGEILALRGDGECPCGHVLVLLDRKLAAVDEQLRALVEFRDELAALRQEAAETTTAGAGICSIIEHHEVTHHADPRAAAGLVTRQPSPAR